MAKKFVFVGRECHVRTQSDLFLLEIMRELGEVAIVRRDYISNEESLQAIQSHSPDTVVYFQLRPEWDHHVWPLRRARQVWVPMWDGFKRLGWKRRLLHRLCGVKVLSFSQKVHDYFTSFGMHSMRVNYFPPPIFAPSSIKKEPPYTVFLWQRDEKIGLDQVAKLFEPGVIGKVIYKPDDPKMLIGSYPFEVERLDGWLSKEQLRSKIQEADYYIAPRCQEGLGHSFVEAMAQGKVVVGYNDATMNEYIRDGVNGHLFDDNGRLSVKWPPPHSIQPNIIDHCTKSYATWLSDRQRIKALLI